MKSDSPYTTSGNNEKYMPCAMKSEMVSNQKFASVEFKGSTTNKEIAVSKYYQQGDVLMFEIEKLPEGLKPVEARNGRFILADGEHTGHAHALEALPGRSLFQSAAGDLFMTVDGEVAVNHEEHGTITLPKKTIAIKRVVEVDPFTDEIGAVKD